MDFLPDIQIVIDAARFPSWKDISKYGGAVILTHNALRLLACVTLLGLSVASSVISGARTEEAEAEPLVKLGLCVFYVRAYPPRASFLPDLGIQLYASLLAGAAVSVATKSGSTAGLHLDLILAVAFGVYFYPRHLPFRNGTLIYAKLVVLTLAAVVIPLVTPRTYVPVDPTNPMAEPNAEQTASPLSLILFSFLDPVILLAYKLPHLPYDLLPPLADTDYSENLKKRGFPNIDTFSGAGKGHIFFGILKTFRSEYATIIVMLLLYVACSFASPIGINRISKTGPPTPPFDPSFGFFWLALGPLTGTTALQAYYRLSAHNPDGDAAKEAASDDASSNDGTLNPNDAQTRSTPAATTNSSVDVGKISNLVTTDLRNVTNMSDFLMLLFYMPVSVVFCIIFLYIVLGWSAFVGMGTMILLFPLSGIASQILQVIQKGRIKAADARIGTISETMNVLRMIKLFGWEDKMLARVNDKREEELHWIWKREIFEWVANTVNNLIPIVTMLTVLMKQELRPSIVFSTMPVFDMLRNQLHMANYRIIQFVDAKVSLDRINDFLHNTELLDQYTEKEETAEFLAAEASTEIGFRDASFTWSNDSDGHKFALRIDDELLFKPGCINLVLGPTGSGKTSLLMALLGEMHFTPSSLNSWCVAYAAQESWVLNETIRSNILFGAEYDEERYNKVLYQCALQRDLELFEAGDQSEVGEKGLTLSGGQKARCTLARAIYSKAEILLLDDWIVEKCFSGDLVQGRTVILVTHNVALAAPIADFTISIGLNGRILSQGSVAEALQHDIALANEANADLQVMEQVVAEEPVEATTKDAKSDGKSDGKLILAEELQLGKVKWSAGYFASQYEISPPGTVSVSYHLGIFGLITLFDVIVHSYGDIIFAYASSIADSSRSILGTTLRWLDITPASRVIARFTADITAVDGPILNVFAGFVHVTISMVISFGAVVFLTPLFSIPGVFAAIIGGTVGQLFIKSSNAKAPVLGHFGAAIAGLTSIRAYGAQGPFIEESLRRINKYTRAARTLSNLDRWVGVRLAAIGNILAAILALYLVYFRREKSNNVGFSLNMAAGFSMRILFWVRIWNDVQIQGEPLERIQQYIDIEQEPKPTEVGKPPAHWPSSGELIVEKLSARYSPDGPKVLRDISFRINSGERVGIVGRTGSGKSSLTLALLRCIYTEGTVHYDGIPTASLNLDALRSNITIIPQMPELLSGTLRHNLDPFDQYDDANLNSALRAAGLFSLQQDMEEGRLVLDSVISSGGSNLSVGQRQILALARAIVRDSKLLILDEATSAIDYKTDTVIQASLRNELKPDVTVITVAHRLQTILDSDKIMVLDEGRIVEFDAPKVLLTNPKGKLRALVDESGDKEKLYAMAEGKGQ
ncbi:P-loop containing nucleoside triphosphate hydrolase protein [Mycena rosella]|uniref:P-loop containing nucleoside triphosphate hydrolase protein n=1 Tax=Mycena rosella TaxID=1033263 RepID=A0AAD7DJJ6_MYCRO|nr:P-loop containing nucleoside triphosphate hydrolase protein [Mycena rosella]